MKTEVQALALLSGLRIRHCCEWWRRPAATALIRPLAWEPPQAAGAALKRPKEKEKERKKVENKLGFGSFSHIHSGGIDCSPVSSRCGSVVTNLTSIHEEVGLIPGLVQCVKNVALP